MCIWGNLESKDKTGSAEKVWADAEGKSSLVGTREEHMPKARQRHLELSSEQKVLGQQATATQNGFNTGTHLMG